MEARKTDRGFPLFEFRDTYNNPCSLQLSSTLEPCIWFGIQDPNLKRIVPGYGWVPFEVPNDVTVHARMHLNVEMVKQLLPILQKFVETDDII